MLDQMRKRLEAQGSFEDAVATVLNDVIALHGAEYGDVQLAAGDCLLIVAQHGFAPRFLHAFRHVKMSTGCACGRALLRGKPVVVRNVETDPGFAPYRSTAREAGFQSVQSTPLCTREGRLLGIVSTHFANIHEPTPIEMSTLVSYAQLAADYLHSLLGGTTLAARAEAMSGALYARL